MRQRLYPLLIIALTVACSTGRVRNERSGDEGLGCQVAEDCDPGFDCLAGGCVRRGGDSMLPKPTRCYADAECPDGQSCVGGACRNVPRDPQPDPADDDPMDDPDPEPGDNDGEDEGEGEEDPPEADPPTTEVREPCVPDRFEPNEDAASATVVGRGTYDELSLCDLDQDFYAVRLAAGAALTVTANGGAGLALQVLAPDGRSVVAGSQAVPNGAQAELPEVPADGRYYLQLAGANVVPAYTLTLRVVGDEPPPDPDPVDPPDPDPVDPWPEDPDPPVACEDDAFEDNDSRNGAALIDAGLYPGLMVCDGEDDWYVLDLARGARVTASIMFSLLEVDLDLSLIGPDGQELALSDDVLTISEEVSAVAAEAGDHFVRVFPFVDPIFQLDSGGYMLTVEVTEPEPEPEPDPEPDPGLCEDPFDPNDALDAAAPIQPGIYDQLTLCGDDDWYLITLDATGPLEVFMTPAPDAGDLDLEVWDDAGNRLVRSERPAGETEGIGGDSVDPGNYYFRVYGYQPDVDQGPYTLDVAY